MRLRLPRTLFGQLALLHVAIALAGAATLPVAVAALLHRVAHRYQHEVLHQQAQRVAAGLAANRGDPARALAQVDLLAGGLTLTIVDARRRVVGERGTHRPAILAAVPLQPRARMIRRGGMAAISRPADGRWIVVSQDDDAPEVVADDIVTTFLKRFALLLLPFVMLGPLAGAWLTRRMTRRMIAASEQAAAIGPRTLDRRLPRDTLPAEIEPLAAATNAALERLEQAFAVQAAFAADVAHELRTPLATIRLRADTLGDAALLGEVDRAARVIAQLLSLADLERPIDAEATPVDLVELAEQVVADRAPAVLGAGLTIELRVDGAATTVAGHGAAIALALENLIDNAVRHTPAATRIVVSAGPGARLCVADDGPVIPAERLVRMRERFWKGEARSGGSGLGLSIVARIAAAHGGALVLEAGDGGRGLRAGVVLGGTDQRHRSP